MTPPLGSIILEKETRGRWTTSMCGSRGGSGPPLEFAKLNIADITGNKKLVIFHICALPQLYVKVGPPWKIFLDPRLTSLT